ncbi:hypothetical protein Csa_004204, partial [Cucumis sativus]
ANVHEKTGNISEKKPTLKIELGISWLQGVESKGEEKKERRKENFGGRGEKR